MLMYNPLSYIASCAGQIKVWLSYFIIVTGICLTDLLYVTLRL